MKSFGTILLILLVFTGSANAQLESSAGNISRFPVDKWYELSIDPDILQKLTGLIQPKDQPYQFAFPVRVNLTPENSGFVKKSGHELIWTIGIRSSSAKSLNVILKPFNIPEGGYVYEYDPAGKIIRGAFGSDNNNSAGVLPLMPVPGEELILEYHVPAGSELEETIGISQVSHDFLGILGSDEKDGRYGLSGPCNVDISCPDGTGYDDEKRAVCRIIINGIELCTGVLVNNTNQQNRALLITAQHCITDDIDASKSIFVFGYESPWCKGPDGHAYHSISGSVLRSTNPDIDFSLVELSSFPPFTYHPYLAGWDVTGAIPNKTAAIHHPMGDVKKISIDLNQPVTGTYSSDYTTNGFWQILQWDAGTTEGGSSGSPLFDQNKRVVGILTGGDAICGNSQNDYFAKLSYSYNLSPLLYKQLKGWIDPAVSGAVKFDGRDPYAPNLLTVDTLSNLSAAEQVSITPYTSGGSGYSTGYNSDSLVMYAEYFSNPSGKDISEILMKIARVNYLAADSATVFILSDGSVPGSVIARQRVLLSEAKDTFLLKVDFKNIIPVAGNFYFGWQIYYKTTALSETRQFAVFHSPDRIDPALNTAWFNDGFSWQKFTLHPFAPMSISLDVKAVVIGNSTIDAVSDQKYEKNDFNIFPNPAREHVVVASAGTFLEANLRIYDNRGALVNHRLIKDGFPGQIEIDLSTLREGIYYLLITAGRKQEAHKLVISR